MENTQGEGALHRQWRLFLLYEANMNQIKPPRRDISSRRNMHISSRRNMRLD